MTIMKIIDGLYFTIGMILFNPLTGESKTPEQLNEDDRTTYDACMGAIALLKAQEPHIMTLEEWREWKRKPLSQRDPVYYVDNKGLGSWIAPNDQLFIYATPELGYGVLFVCWTSRPTDEQREAIPWG